jgi:hypothetical protein
MATTNAYVQSVPGVSTTRLYMSTAGGTGTPAVGGYLNNSESGGWYYFNNITEALVGLFFYRILNSSSQVLANGIINLADDTGTYYGFDPPSSNHSTWHNLNATISSRTAESDSATRQTALIAEHDATQATLAGLNNLSIANVQTAMTNQGYTTTRAPFLDNLDAAISSRATPAQVTTQLTSQGLTSARAAFLDNLDATISSRLSESTSSSRQTTLLAEHDATQATLAGLDVSSQVQSAMTAQGYTTTRAPNLDNLNATISSRQSETDAATRATTNQTEHDATQSSLAALDVGAAVTASLTSQGLTSTRAGYLDNLDATISSRESESSASSRATTDQTEHDATQTAIGSISATVDEAAIAAAVWDALTSAAVTSGTFGKLVKDYLDAAITSRAVASDVTAGLTSQGYTTARAPNLDNLDAAVTTRATPAQVATALTDQGLTTTRAAFLDNLDATVSSRATPAQVTTALTDQGLTGTRAGYLDNLDAMVSSRATPAQVTTQLTDQGLTTTRAAKLDNLDNIVTAPPTAAAIADAVLDEALSGHNTAGTAGEGIILARDQSTIAANNTQA